MSDFLPGPEKVDCPDGCGLFGRPTRNGHVRGCRGPEGQPCWSCLGRRNRQKGARKQRAARKGLGIKGTTTLGADHEENWRGFVRVEVKAGAQVRPAFTLFRKMRAQSELSRAIGDFRPFVGVAMPDGVGDGILLIRMSDLTDVALAVIAGMEDTDGTE